MRIKAMALEMLEGRGARGRRMRMGEKSAGSMGGMNDDTGTK
jgi:hypothetical protein